MDNLSSVCVIDFYQDDPFEDDNVFEMVGVGTVLVTDENLKIGDWVVNKRNGKCYLVTGINKRMSLTSPPFPIKPFEYILRHFTTLPIEDLRKGEIE